MRVGVHVELNEAIELFVRHEDAEAMVENWRRDEPDEADALRVEEIRLRA